MNAEPIRMVAAALADATLGVNAQIAALTLDSTVAGVMDTRPVNIVSIKNQADHNIDVHEGDNEFQYPLIVVLMTDPTTGPGQVWSGVQDSVGDVHCVLVTRSGTQSFAFLTTDYYLRAMKKAVHVYLLSVGRDVQRKRNNIAISNSTAETISYTSGSFMGGQVAGVLKITLNLRDLSP